MTVTRQKLPVSATEAGIDTAEIPSVSPAEASSGSSFGAEDCPTSGS
jgi:hypothetical protein